MNVVILVPRRDDGGHRDRLWAWCKARWQAQHPYPIVEGYHRDGLFNRSKAVNEAARLAGDWDVAVIIDSDIVIDPGAVRAGIDLAAQSGRMVLPYYVRKDLHELGTKAIIDGREGSWDPLVRKRYRNLVSSVVIIPRALWDTIGGFDEAFRGWGGEDDAFAACAQTFAGIERLPGDVWHLWHPGNPEGRRASAGYAANKSRAMRYRRATGKPAVIRELQAESSTILTQPDLIAAGIPRIFHRVVPAITRSESEKWWAEFEAMHPGWEMMTHRDPLDPADWPLTAPHWSKAANGAQFADLIRLEALLRWGGVYIDSDVQPIHSFEPLLHLYAFAAWEDERCVPNAVMGAIAGHPAIRACLDTMLMRLPGPTWQAGPGVLTDILPWREDVLLLPPTSFYPVHYRDPDRATKMADPQLVKRNPWCFAVHHYWYSWKGANEGIQSDLPAQPVERDRFSVRAGFRSNRNRTLARADRLAR